MAREIENVQITVLKRAQSQLSGTTSLDFPGVDLDTKSIDEWIELRVQGPTSAPARKGERNEGWFLVANCFAKTGETSAGVQRSNIHRTKELADAVNGVFGQADLNLQDWGAVGDPVIGVLRFEEADGTEVQGPVGNTDLQQYNVTIPFTVIL